MGNPQHSGGRVMARSRNIKPGIITNDELASTSPFARLVFIYSWMLADYNGNLEYKPVKLKVQTLPYDDVDIDGLVTELERFGFVKRYDENGSRYMHICNFKKHQNPHKNEITRGSDIPVFDESKASKEPKEKALIKQGDTEDSGKIATKTEQVPSQNGTDPADSLSLIPDSGYLIPDPIELPCASDDAPLAGENNSDELYSDDFNAFWSAYPLKKGKKLAAQKLKTAKKKNPSPSFITRIIEDVKCRSKGHEWLKSQGEFIPHAATYLNQERWNDPAPNVSAIQSRHTGFADRDYSEGLIEGVADNAANF
jgi:uncharacterized protein YlbG (UPF0298 family)